MPRPGDKIRIRQRADGPRYEARWQEPDGTPRGKTFRTREEARAHLVAVEHSVNQGVYVPRALGQTPFRQVVDEWLTKGKPRKPRTVELYRSMVATWLDPWLDRPVASIGYADVSGLVAQMRAAGRSPQTIHNVFNVAHGALGFALDAGYIATNPAARVRRNLPDRNAHDPAERRPLTAEQVQALAALLPDPYGLVVRFGAWSGLRAGEVAGLRVKRVNVLRSEVRVEETVVRLGGVLVPGTPKSKKSRRTVPVPPSLAREVGAYIAARGLGPDDYVFGNDDGSPINMQVMYRTHYRKARVKIGRPDLTVHHLRHTYASLMAPHIDMLELSRRMGHQNFAFTANVYSHLYEHDDPGKAAALDALYTAAGPAAGPIQANDPARSGVLAADQA
jgi:integrase